MDREEKQEKLKKLRKETGMSRREFSREFDIPYPTITDWELGNRRVPEYLLRLLTYKIKMDERFVSKQQKNSVITVSFTIEDIKEILKGKGMDATEEEVRKFIEALDLQEFRKQCVNEGKKLLEGYTL